MFACLVTRTKFGGSRLQYNEFLEKQKMETEAAIGRIMRRIAAIDLSPDWTSEMTREQDQEYDNLETAQAILGDIEWAKTHW